MDLFVRYIVWISELEEHKRTTGSVKDFPGTEAITNDEILELDVVHLIVR